MKKKKKQKQTLIVLTLIMFIFAYILYKAIIKNTSSFNQSNNYQMQFPVNEKWYHSSILKFSILVPAGYTIEDKLSSIILEKEGKKIIMDRNGNSYTNIKDYLKDFDRKRNIKIHEEKQININGLNTVSRIESNITDKLNMYKIYFIFNNYSVYGISTEAESLFSDLDKIAQSFHYIP